MISYAYASHGDFGIYEMALGDALLWSGLGILVGAILIFLCRDWM